MTFYQKVATLCIEKGVSITRVATDLGFSSSTPNNWRGMSGLPRLSTIRAIADYFGVDVSYFTSDDSIQTAQNSLFVDPSEEIIVKAYRQADAAGKARIIQVAMNESDRSQSVTHTIYRAARSADHSEHRIEERTTEEMAKFRKATPVTSDDDL